MPFKLCGVLLAAGNSTRFGGQKLIHPLSNGDLIGVASAKNLKSVISNCVSVVSNDTDQLAQFLIKEGHSLLVNKNNNGIGSSIACAIKQSKADAWVIALADMPYIKCETIHEIARMLSLGHRIVAPVCNDHRGHPVGFSSYYRKELIALKSDHGAKSIIESYPKDVKFFNTSDAGCLIDIDYRKDLKEKEPVN